MFIQETLKFVVDILKVPSVLVGLIALIGLLAQKKSFSDVVKGTVKPFSALSFWRRRHGIGRIAQSAGRHVRTRV